MDIEYLLAWQSLREATGGVFDAAVAGFTDIGLMAFSMIVPMLVLWCINKEAGILSVFSMSIGSVGNQLAKNTACVYRPWIRSDELHPVVSAMTGATGYSFPSGHTQGTASSMLAIAWSMRKRVVVVVLCIVAVLLMGLSRNYVGVHTPQDVVVGLLMGIASVVAAVLVLKWAEGGANRDAIVLVVGLVAIAAALVYFVMKPYPLDYVNSELLVDPAKMINDCFSNCGILAGVLVSWFIDRRWLRFTIDGSIPERIVRFVVGVTAALAIFYVLRPLIIVGLGAWWGRLFAYFLMYFFAMVLYPWLFMRVHRALEARRAV